MELGNIEDSNIGTAAKDSVGRRDEQVMEVGRDIGHTSLVPRSPCITGRLHGLQTVGRAEWELIATERIVRRKMGRESIRLDIQSALQSANQQRELCGAL